MSSLLSDAGGSVELQNVQSVNQITAEAKAGNWAWVMIMLDTTLESYHDFSEAVDLDNRTILHWACLRKGHKRALDIVESILDKFYTFRFQPSSSAMAMKNVDEPQRFQNDMRAFINKMDKEQKTALHLAAENKNKKLVELLISKGADVTLPNNGDHKDAIMLIYKNLPSVILNLFDENLILEKVEDIDYEDQTLISTKNTDETLWKMEWDFTPIVGVEEDSKEEDPEPFPSGESCNHLHCQTNLLSYVLRQTKQKQSQVLLHPLVRLFLYYKHEKFRTLLWLSIIYHLWWYIQSISFFLFIIFLYTEDLADQLINSNLTSPVQLSLNESQRFSFNFTEETAGSMTILVDKSFTFWLIFIAQAILMGGMIYKEVLEFFYTTDKRNYVTDIENVGQWLLLISAVTVHIIDFTSAFYCEGRCRHFIIYFATIGILTASFLIPLQFLTEGLGIYMNMLGMVTKNVLTFLLLFFSPLLITYSLLFSFLMPAREEFHFPGMLSKVFAMMTGEIEYNDVFYNNDDDMKSRRTIPYPILTQLLFLVFEVTVIIVLQNLLVSLAVSDTQELKKDAKENQIAAQLEEIDLIEHFILSQPTKTIILKVWGIEWLKDFMVTPKGKGRYLVFGNPKTNAYTIYGCTTLDDSEETNELVELPARLEDIILTAIKGKL